LYEATLPDGLGQLLEFGLLEGLARVGGGLVDGVDREKSAHIGDIECLRSTCPRMISTSERLNELNRAH
jgi:hypothetical protein